MISDSHVTSPCNEYLNIVWQTGRENTQTYTPVEVVVSCSEWPTQNFSLHYPYDIDRLGDTDEKREKYEFVDN